MPAGGVRINKKKSDYWLGCLVCLPCAASVPRTARARASFLLGAGIATLCRLAALQPLRHYPALGSDVRGVSRPRPATKMMMAAMVQPALGVGGLGRGSLRQPWVASTAWECAYCSNVVKERLEFTAVDRACTCQNVVSNKRKHTQ